MASLQQNLMGVYVAAFYPPLNPADPAYQASVETARIERAVTRSREKLCIACGHPFELGVCKPGECGRPDEARRQQVNR
jgi:hypothetical protein